ncbi:tyrosine-type recombinase/integrase [Mesorhizobium sp. J428]|uniref:tyrosine-type recombinase/integrase n=1 Tax=Mesorhizobium sp. J428 TaxID=2898440 RepID=UPI0021513333|nr:tyrosine-type recombinase/integrase [Mesorhizobium sp. J428]MCR5857964.1 tyrosine-type recombinase/integrase [Mesorhizobium sp. J428]
MRKRLADGSVRTHYYYRSSGKPLKGKPGSVEFLEAYAAAERTLSQRHEGTLVQLIRAYILSPEFEKRAESTRKEYQRMLTKVEAHFGTMPIAALDDPRVRQDFIAWRAEVSRTFGDREADNRLSVVSAMISWARDNGRVTANHVSGFRRLHRSDQSELIWMPEHIEAFMKVAPIEMQRALILALHTGQRQGDLRRLTWSNYDGELISLRQGKGQRRVEIPCTTALRRMLDAVPRASTMILSTKSGLPWTARYFNAQWEAATKKAGIDNLHFHDLRGTADHVGRGGLHDAADRRNYRAFAQDGFVNSRPLSSPNSCAGDRGNGPFRERNKHRFCKPSANRRDDEARKAR